MAAIALKIKNKDGQHVLKDLTSESTVGELKIFLSSLSDVGIERIHVLFGYPPKPLDISNDNKKLKEIGLKTGETLILEEKQAQENAQKNEPQKPVENGVVSHETIGSCRPGILMKKVVPPDNSCLFTSIGFVLNGNVDTSVHSLMRQIIAMEVASDRETYNEGVLGQPNADYCAWIQQPSSWGGAIEGGLQTIFPSEDMEIYREAEQLAHEAKSSRQFTDLNKFTLKCLVCNKFLTGQAEAQRHAKETKHTNFGEF